ncbi:PA2169 family four-helix-bundle protein [Flavobacterium sp. N3904]|uniref:PA2169 family four-helix-bundle protein n=1 Tax=Flavobacterium sp. N3904 TaxID=2986835 RepID=UPI002224A908|nr:PA2169 family four-helix-bundle protein [Flavobacterium sp. N3904]
MDRTKSIDALNNLISINNNRFESYAKASRQTDESDLIMLFIEFQEKSKKCKTELVSEVHKLGGKPINDSSISLPFMQVWIKIKSKFKSNDREDILNRCEHDDDITIKTYKNVLSENSENLTEIQQNMLTAQHQSIKIDHDILKDLGNVLVSCRKFTLDT